MSPRSLLATSAAASRPIRPVLLAKGFRPFFLLAAALAVVALPIWLIAFAGTLDVLAYLSPMYWHAHEMVFGFATAVIAGFLLTAASNWTGRDTAVGPALGALVLLWLAGRVAVLAADALPRGLAAGIDLAFLPALVVACARPIIASKNRRNYGFIGLLAALWLANLGVHLGALGIRSEWLRLGNLVGVDLATLAIVLVSGRVLPMFTRNATKVQSIKNVPMLDRAAVVGMALLTLIDAASFDARAAAAIAGVTGVLTLARTAFWGARHTVAQPLLWILHLGHAFVPLGLVLRALSALTPAIPSSSALHSLTAGAIGAMTLGMMTRVGLGHTGRMLAVSRLMSAAFASLLIGALLRVVAPFFPASYVPWVVVAGIFWVASFAIYLARNAAALASPRVDGKPG